MVMELRENNVGTVSLVGTLLASEAGTNKLLGAPESRNGLGSGLLKVIRSDNWQTKPTIARGNFIV